MNFVKATTFKGKQNRQNCKKNQTLYLMSLIISKEFIPFMLRIEKQAKSAISSQFTKGGEIQNNNKLVYGSRADFS